MRAGAASGLRARVAALNARRPASRVFGLTTATLALAAPAAHAQGGGNGIIYMAGYDHAIHVIDENTMEVVDRIELTTGIPTSLALSENHERIYVRDAEFEEIEIVDVATRKSIDSFSLSEGRSKVRIWGMTVDPDEEFVILNTMRYTKEIDRWEIGDPTLLKYDLEAREVTDTIPWPDGELRSRARLMFSPDGEYLYFFGAEIRVLDPDDYSEVDRWDLSRPLEEGLGRMSFGFPSSPHDDPGYYTSLLRFTDPVQNRRMMGIARVNLAEKEYEFFTLGPSQGVSFRLAPGGKKAYGLVQQIGNYEFWTFDVEGRRVENRQRFPGRPRMSLEVSSNGEFLYIYNAGSTIDIYGADSYEFIRTVTFDADMTHFLMIPEGTGPRGG